MKLKWIFITIIMICSVVFVIGLRYESVTIVILSMMGYILLILWLVSKIPEQYRQLDLDEEIKITKEDT